MWLHIDLRSHVPMYQQIINAIKEQIARGQLNQGDQLPTVRELATDLSINHNTVAKAYQELEREHVIELVRGRGTFVSSSSDVPNVDVRMRELRDALKRWLVDAHHLHLTDEEIHSMLDDLRGELRKGEGGDTGGSGIASP